MRLPHNGEGKQPSAKLPPAADPTLGTPGSNNRHPLWLRFLVYSLTLLLLLAIISSTFYWQEATSVRKRMALEQAHHLRLNSVAISYNLKQLGYSLLFLADQVRLHQPFDNPEGRKIFADDMVSFLNTTELFDHLRLLGLDGRELARANYNQGHPALVPPSELQNKANRYYFNETIELAPDSVFISPLDLNVENGHVEQPYKPSIRFGIPVNNRQGKKAGALVLNYLASHMLRLLARQNENLAGQLMLLNRDGYWLLSPDSKQAWGFMFPHRIDETLQRKSPHLWRKIMATDSGQFESQDKLYAFATIYPLRELAEIPHMRMATDSNQYFWKLVSEIPQTAIIMRTSSLRANILSWSVALALLLIALAWLMARTVEQRRKAGAQLHYMAHHDALTDLPNRMVFNVQLDQALALARRHRSSFAVLYLDLNKFKPVNDTYGHEVGDILLQGVAQRLLQCVRDSDTVARMGGDEFAIVLSELDKSEDAALMAEKVLETLEKPFEILTHTCHISASIGVAVYPDHGIDRDTLIRSADAAMYHAKP